MCTHRNLFAVCQCVCARARRFQCVRMISGRACRDRISVRACFSVCVAHVSLLLTVDPSFRDGLSKTGI